MYRNKKIVIIVVAAIFLIPIIIALVLFLTSGSNDTGSNNLTNVNSEEAKLPDTGGEQKVITEIKEVDTATLRKVTNNEADIRNSSIFVVENMGSYSTDTYDFVNLRNAKLLATNEMKNYIDSLILSYQQNNPKNNQYYGVTTKALSVEILTIEVVDSGEPVQVVVSTQRIETMGENNPISSTKYRKMEVELIKTGDKWLVSSARWQ